MQHVNLVLVTTAYGVSLYSSDFKSEKLFTRRPNSQTDCVNMALIEPVTKSLIVARSAGYNVDWATRTGSGTRRAPRRR